MRVERRLLTAQRGAGLLDRKQRIMADELDRLTLYAEVVRAEWKDVAHEAALWLRRASALDGATALEAGAPSRQATVEVRWGAAMGVTYPVDALCLPSGSEPMGGSSALSFAAQAHHEALVVAVRYAAAQRAVALLTAELVATRTRQRAVENRWIPKLEEELRIIRSRLEEQELEETLRVHWAAENNERRRGSPLTADVPKERETR
ncbi:MAG: V-type ATP synthase subunit D [Dermatophilaceae bacterium]